MDTAIFLALLAFCSAVITGFFKLYADQLKVHERLVESLDKNTSSNADIATATKKSADEAESRNGHLAELAIQNKDQIIEAIHGLTIDKQTVHNQVVEHEVVNNKE